MVEKLDNQKINEINKLISELNEGSLIIKINKNDEKKIVISISNKEDKVGRPKKYNSEEERKIAKKNQSLASQKKNKYKYQSKFQKNKIKKINMTMDKEDTLSILKIT